jgi:hypothetical protein
MCTEIFVQITGGKDEEEPLSSRCRYSAPGTEKQGSI